MRDILGRTDLPISPQWFDLDGHSLGGFTGAETAQHKPEYVRSLIMVASAGLTGHTRRSMARRVPSFVHNDLRPAVSELHLEDNVSALFHMVDYVFKNPVRTAVEGWAVGGCDIRPPVKRLGQLGIKTAVLAFPQDHFFDIEQLRTNIADSVDIFEDYDDPAATHTKPQRDPAGVARVLINLHDRLTG